MSNSILDLQLFNFEVSKDEIHNNFIKAGNIHKKIIDIIKPKIREDLPLINIAELIENTIKREVDFKDLYPQRLDKGIGFPIGLSLNECAAHWTPNPLDNRKLTKNDLLKIDYGIHIGGCIVDGAYSFSLENKFDELIQIANDATSLAIKMSGVDTILGDIGTEVQEFIESHEIMLDGKMRKVKSFRDLTGHKIIPWVIHSDKCVPNFSIPYNVRMEEGEYYAIETFPSTGIGKGEEQNEVSHYQVNVDLLLKEYRELNNINCNTGGKILNPIKLDKKENYVYHRILNLYETLPFCKRWLKEEKVNKYQLPLKSLVNKKRIKAFPPINDINGSYVAQSEKTIYIGKNGVTILN
tara:strand:- start:418 stop:1476 length:1059 start_codon:yes stop_codon:yes gene_type:complete